MKKAYYITTPIYYITDKPHIGHLYTTVAADIMARYQRLQGKDVWFLTGTDEHGQKIQKKAVEGGETPQALADRVVERYQEAWKLFDITYNDFIRTTEDRHKSVVTHYMKTLMDKGDIYLDQYEGWYCVPDESYWTETQVVDGKCPECGRPVERLKEESYFFKMSAYTDKLLKHIEENPDFIFPDTRKNEVLGLLKQGVRDISVSRTTLQWGIPMPADGKATKQHRVYVWFDALTNYISALGPLEKDPEKMNRYWPKAIHIVGKDILKFHAIYWPTFLMALGLPLPKKIVAHGWLTVANRKIGKSLGNMVEPISLGQEVGIDALRYFLFREFVFGSDGEYTKELVYNRINADLANDYGNCLSRVCNLIEKNLSGMALDRAAILNEKSDLRKTAEESIPVFHEALEAFGFQRALEALWRIVGMANRYLEANAPWTLAKSKEEADQKKMRTVLLHAHEALRIVSVLAHPFIPAASTRALDLLGDTESLKNAVPTERAYWGKATGDLKVTKGTPLFPRLELKAEALTQ